MIPRIKDTNLVAVYWTLKKKNKNWEPYGNHWAMINAWGKFIKESYVEFSKLAGHWFPVAKFEIWTDKFLKVEIYEVSKEWVAWPLDRLEWHPREREDWTYPEPTFYKRKEVPTTDWDTVTVYEIVRDIDDTSEQWEEESDIWDGSSYYNWL